MMRLVHHDFALPDDRVELTDEEHAWMTFLRDIYGGEVRGPTLRAVQALRTSLGEAGL
ncbi:MAG: hypothetical protein ACEPO2_07065 [Pelagibaca sp.]